MARSFPGGANYLNVGDISAIDLTGSVATLFCWVNATSVGGVNRVAIGKWQPGNQQYVLYIDVNSKVTCQISDDGSNTDIVTGSTNLSTSTWHQICGRKNGSSFQVFLDGHSDGNNPGSTRSIGNLSGPLRFGQDSFAQDWVGLIAEVALWNVALSDTDITSLSTGRDPRTFSPSNIKGYWPLCGVASPELELISSNSASIVGSVTFATHPFTSVCSPTDNFAPVIYGHGAI